MTNYKPGDLVHWGGSLWEVVEISMHDVIITQSISGGHSTYQTVPGIDLTPAPNPMKYRGDTIKAAQAAASTHKEYMAYVKELGSAIRNGTLKLEQGIKLDRLNEACNRAQLYLMVCVSLDLKIELTE